jgi:hypothetical protein
MREKKRKAVSIPRPPAVDQWIQGQESVFERLAAWRPWIAEGLKRHWDFLTYEDCPPSFSDPAVPRNP